MRSISPLRKSLRMRSTTSSRTAARGISPPHVWVSGERSVGSGIAVEASDIWHLGSITKSMTATLVEIIAEDRPGLLYSLATVLSSAACNIDVVLIDTKGNRAIDVFYVAHQGAKLTPEVQATLKERLLAVC